MRTEPQSQSNGTQNDTQNLFGLVPNEFFTETGDRKRRPSLESVELETNEPTNDSKQESASENVKSETPSFSTEEKPALPTTTTENTDLTTPKQKKKKKQKQQSQNLTSPQTQTTDTQTSHDVTARTSPLPDQSTSSTTMDPTTEPAFTNNDNPSSLIEQTPVPTQSVSTENNVTITPPIEVPNQNTGNNDEASSSQPVVQKKTAAEIILEIKKEIETFAWRVQSGGGLKITVDNQEKIVPHTIAAIYKFIKEHEQNHNNNPSKLLSKIEGRLFKNFGCFSLFRASRRFMSTTRKYEEFTQKISECSDTSSQPSPK